MQAPDFTLTNIRTGKKCTLSDYRGNIIMLTFWVSWCPDCLHDLPQKETFYQTNKRDDLVFLTINVTGREGQAEDAVNFLEKNPYTFPVLKDEGTKTYDAYGCTSVPTTVLIDKNHDISATYGDQDPFVSIVQKLGDMLESK